MKSTTIETFQSYSREVFRRQYVYNILRTISFCHVLDDYTLTFLYCKILFDFVQNGSIVDGFSAYDIFGDV